MTTTTNVPTDLPSHDISVDLLELARQLATDHPLPAELADDVAPLTARLLKGRIAGNRAGGIAV
jgi:hypothetical protein